VKNLHVISTIPTNTTYSRPAGNLKHPGRKEVGIERSQEKRHPNRKSRNLSFAWDEGSFNVNFSQGDGGDFGFLIPAHWDDSALCGVESRVFPIRRSSGNRLELASIPSLIAALTSVGLPPVIVFISCRNEFSTGIRQPIAIWQLAGSHSRPPEPPGAGGCPKYQRQTLTRFSPLFHHTSVTAMYIKALQLENVRSFTDLNFDLERPDGSFAGWTVFVGGNSSGKSTILRSAALALIGPEAGGRLTGSPTGWIHKGQTKASAVLKVKWDRDHDKFKKG